MFPMHKVLRTLATDDTEGFMEMLVGWQDDRIFGRRWLARRPVVMAVVQTAKLAELPCLTLRDAVTSHLTVTEGLGALFEDLPAVDLS